MFWGLCETGRGTCTEGGRKRCAKWGYRNLPLLSGPGQRVHESCLFRRAQKGVSILWLGRKCPRWRHPLGLVFCPLNEIHLGRARSACGGVQPTPCLLSRLLPAAAFSVGPRLGAVPGTPPQSALGLAAWGSDWQVQMAAPEAGLPACWSFESGKGRRLSLSRAGARPSLPLSPRPTQLQC